MLSTFVPAFPAAALQITIYLGFFIITSGVLGNALKIIIFSSLKTFRETSSGFYLTTASCVNILHLLSSFLSCTLSAGYGIDLTQSSRVLCKMRQFVAVTSPLMVETCLCLVTIDQFLCLSARWRFFSQRQVAWRLTGLAALLWLFHGIPVMTFFDIVLPAETSTSGVCLIINENFSAYFYRVYLPFLLGFVPLGIRIVFGFLAFIRVRRLPYREVSIIRSERDKQLTAMVSLSGDRFPLPFLLQ